MKDTILVVIFSLAYFGAMFMVGIALGGVTK